MQVKIDSSTKLFDQAEFKVIGVYQQVAKTKNQDKKVDLGSIKNSDLKNLFKKIKSAHSFSANKGESFIINDETGNTYCLLGLGIKNKSTTEDVRRNTAAIFKNYAGQHESVSFDLDSLSAGSFDRYAYAAIEGVLLANYSFEKYKSVPTKNKLKILSFKVSSKHLKKTNLMLKNIQKISESIFLARDLATEAPNYLHSVKYSQIIAKDVKDNLKNVKTKILTKAMIQKENMNLLLSVNAGSAYEPRLVHLTYTPTKKSKNSKHIALVGKGITFDTGGYSLKPAANIMGMKFDMAGSSTLYGAFRSAVLLGSPHKITCILAMTDNAVSSTATFPDSVIKSRNGKSVEILNTDAEGRLILADALDYAGDLKPDVIIDAATLTGACLVALGDEVCGLMSNSTKLVESLKKSAKNVDEYIWQLPIMDEWRTHIKSNIADIKNIGKPMRAGTAVAAAFLEEFIQEGIEWAHLDIAGVAHDQSHLPYCPNNGGSGIMVRTVTDYLLNV